MCYKLFLLSLTFLAAISCKEKAKPIENINSTQLTEEEIINQTTSVPEIDSINALAYSDPCGTERKAVETGKTKWLIIKNSSYANLSENYQPNEIILITDKKEIIRMERLLLNNAHPVIYLCGYDYQVLFWTKPDSLLWNEVYNSECHSYCFDQKQIEDVMSRHIMHLRTKPTHYLYNLKIDVKTNPDAVIEAFKGSNTLLFFITSQTGMKLKEDASHFYYVQLADESSDINTVRNKFKNYKIIEEITEVTE